MKYLANINPYSIYIDGGNWIVQSGTTNVKQLAKRFDSREEAQRAIEITRLDWGNAFHDACVEEVEE